MNKIKLAFAVLAMTASFGASASENKLADQDVICNKYAENFIMRSLKRAEGEFILPLGLEAEDCGDEVAGVFKRVRNSRESFQIDGYWMHLYQDDQPYLSIPLEKLQYIGVIRHVKGVGIYLLDLGWDDSESGIGSRYYSAYTTFEEAMAARNALAQAYNQLKMGEIEIGAAEEIESEQADSE